MDTHTFDDDPTRQSSRTGRSLPFTVTMEDIETACNLIRYDLDSSEVKNLLDRANRDGNLTLEALVEVIYRFSVCFESEGLSPQDNYQHNALLYAIVLLGIMAASLPLDFSQRHTAQSILLRLLTSADPLERWVSLLALGYLQDEHAFDLLLTLLPELVPLPHGLDDRATRHDSLLLEPVSEGIRWLVPALLWRWGDPHRVAPVFRAALEKSLAFERAIPRPSSEDESRPVLRIGTYLRLNRDVQEYMQKQDPWLRYQEILLYGLGRLGAFGALAGLDLPLGVYGKYGFNLWYQDGQRFDEVVTDVMTMPLPLMVFRVQMVIGALGREAIQMEIESTFDKHLPLAQAVEQGLMRGFGLDHVESRRCMRCYERALLSDSINPLSLVAMLWQAWDTSAERKE